jgi:hypothetical protein
MSFLPTTAPPGNPPERIFANVVMSGVTPTAFCSPPGDTRNPVTTSSKIKMVPACLVSSRRCRKKDVTIGILPKLAPVGSRITAAISL